MKIKILYFYCLFVFILLSSCKSRFIVDQQCCYIIKIKDSINYQFKPKYISKELDNYDGLLKQELKNFYITKYKYDYISYSYNRNIWFYDRIYFDDVDKRWVHIKDGKESNINNTFSYDLNDIFDGLESGSFLIRDESNNGFLKTYLIKQEGFLKTEAVKTSQVCSLSQEDKLHSLKLIEIILNKDRNNIND
ncbi:hypothetical protein ACG2LH_07130 [Zhouia sp. PK063]|uniref:hypothetical protein n=1 Tax=Zhouia sp. PK063 TaxID=3373602 RepID=UPI0037ACCD14